MNYEEAKAFKQNLEEKNNNDSDNLKAISKQEKTTMGLTPDHIMVLPEWKIAKNAFERSFAELRNFNGWFVKNFKKEYAAEKRNRIPN